MQMFQSIHTEMKLCTVIIYVVFFLDVNQCLPPRGFTGPYQSFQILLIVLLLSKSVMIFIKCQCSLQVNLGFGKNSQAKETSLLPPSRIPWLARI